MIWASLLNHTARDWLIRQEDKQHKYIQEGSMDDFTIRWTRDPDPSNYNQFDGADDINGWFKEKTIGLEQRD